MWPTVTSCRSKSSYVFYSCFSWIKCLRAWSHKFPILHRTMLGLGRASSLELASCCCTCTCYKMVPTYSCMFGRSPVISPNCRCPSSKTLLVEHRKTKKQNAIPAFYQHSWRIHTHSSYSPWHYTLATTNCQQSSKPTATGLHMQARFLSHQRMDET